jgi:hypothetical protein
MEHAFNRRNVRRPSSRYIANHPNRFFSFLIGLKQTLLVEFYFMIGQRLRSTPGHQLPYEMNNVGFEILHLGGRGESMWNVVYTLLRYTTIVFLIRKYMPYIYIN